MTLGFILNEYFMYIRFLNSFPSFLPIREMVSALYKNRCESKHMAVDNIKVLKLALKIAMNTFLSQLR